MSAYDALASVYDWLVPDVLLEPAGAIAAFGDVLAPGGLLTGTSRNWERLRARRPGLEIPEALVALPSATPA